MFTRLVTTLVSLVEKISLLHQKKLFVAPLPLTLTLSLSIPLFVHMMSLHYYYVHVCMKKTSGACLRVLQLE